MKALACVLLLGAVLLVASDDASGLKEQIDALIPDVDLSEGEGKMNTTPLKAKLFQLRSKLQKELDDLDKQKKDLANGLAKANLKLHQAQKLYNASSSQLEGSTPDKMRADFDVVHGRAALEVVIRAARRQLKFNNLERQALYAQVKFINEAHSLTSKVVGQKPSLELLSVQDLEEQAMPQSLELLAERKETENSKMIKKELTEMLGEVQKRLKELDAVDSANSDEIKKLQMTLKKGLEGQTKATDAWKDAKKTFKAAEKDLAKSKGMVAEMTRMARRDTISIDEKSHTIRKELKLVKAMVSKIDSFQ